MKLSNEDVRYAQSILCMFEAKVTLMRTLLDDPVCEAGLNKAYATSVTLREQLFAFENILYGNGRELLAQRIREEVEQKRVCNAVGNVSLENAVAYAQANLGLRVPETTGKQDKPLLYTFTEKALITAGCILLIAYAVFAYLTHISHDVP